MAEKFCLSSHHKVKNFKNFRLSDGLPSDTKNNIKFIPHGNIAVSTKILDKFKKKICCILIEPIQGSLPDIQHLEYIKFLQDYSKKNNLIFFLDEMITGLRDNGRSFQINNNIKSDISVFGKAFGGGLPLGIIKAARPVVKPPPEAVKSVDPVVDEEEPPNIYSVSCSPCYRCSYC